MTGMHAYNGTDEAVLDTYRRIHANGEQTHVAIVTAGDYYAAIAYDLGPGDFVPIAAECVAFDPTTEGARERARRWMEQHPKGVLDEDDSGGSSGVLRALWGIVKKLDDYGNQQVDTIQQNEKS